MRYRRQGFTAIIGLAFVFLATAAGAAPQNMIHGRPAFDSGWTDIGGIPLQIFHDLGGDVDDYVVDVQFLDIAGEGNIGVHQMGFGGDRFDSSPADVRGVSLLQLTTTNVTLIRHSDEDHIGQVRVRIWIVPNPDYDSGWQSLAAGATLTLTHGLGGDTDDYVVDLMFKNGNTINQDGYGLDAHTDVEGASWFDLGTDTVKVLRGPEDTKTDEIRLRIFRRPDPSWDSGWQTISLGADLTLTHNLGGPWNDIFVDLQFDDSNDGSNINQIGLGGDEDNSENYGAYWWGLTGSKIVVSRNPDDGMADRVRVRLWATRRPAYDSGWRTIATGNTIGLHHGLSGDTDSFVVDLQFKDSDDSLDAGINTYKYGGDIMYDFSTSEYDRRGATWRNLNSTVIGVYRWPDDLTAGQVRVRMWQAAPPDYDSGWRSIDLGQVLSLTHNVGGSTADYVVDLQFRSPTGGVNHIAFGQDQYYDTTSSSYEGHGAYWRALTESEVEVRRMPDDTTASEIRLRIWRGTLFDEENDLTNASNGAYQWEHNLGVDPSEIVVYQTTRSSNATFGTNQYRFGGDRIYFGDWNRYGVWWENLSSNQLMLWKALDDTESEDIMTRLWWTGPSDSIFSDGFESGDTSFWTTP